MKLNKKSSKNVLKKNNSRKVTVLGGIGEKKSNKGTQWYLQNRIYDINGLCPALTRTKSDFWIIMTQKELIKVINKNFDKVNENQYITTTRDGNTFAVPTKYRGKSVRKQIDNYVLKDNEKPTKDYRIRKLTPRECERLQAFPDDWTKYGKNDEEISDTQRYKMCGNAVTTTVITHLINEMFGGLNDEDK